MKKPKVDGSKPHHTTPAQRKRGRWWHDLKSAKKSEKGFDLPTLTDAQAKSLILFAVGGRK